jgi:hypothetical protein
MNYKNWRKFLKTPNELLSYMNVGRKQRSILDMQLKSNMLFNS